MKKLFTYLLLIFFSFLVSIYADEIQKLEIEEISIGDSLLKHLSKKEILENYEFIYHNEKSFSKDIAGIFYRKDLTEYDSVQIDFKFKDPKFTIVGISGFLDYNNNLDSCYKKQNEIFEDLNVFLDYPPTHKGDIKDHPGYPKGEVKTKTFSFFLNNDERSNLEVMCVDALNMKDRLSLSIKSTEFNNWMFKLYN